MQNQQLKEKLNDLKKELVKVNAQIAMGTAPENPGRTKEIRRTIARIKTILNITTREVKKKDA